MSSQVLDDGNDDAFKRQGSATSLAINRTRSEISQPEDSDNHSSQKEVSVYLKAWRRKNVDY